MKTMKDFEKSVQIIEKQFINYKVQFGWDYTKEMEVLSDGKYHVIYFANKMTTSAIKFNSEHGILDIASMGTDMIKKLMKMQNSLEGNTIQ